VQIFYVPFPEDQVQTALATINSSATNNPVDTYISIAAVADGTLIYYDHWEDGYEADNDDETVMATPTPSILVEKGASPPTVASAGDGVSYGPICSGSIDEK